MTRFSAQDLDDEIEEKRELGTILMPNKGKRKIKEDSLVFETKIVDRDGNEITVGAIGMLLEEAKKLSWKHFKNYMIRNGGIDKNFSRKNEIKLFYVDEEKDDIFVDTDDEYKELLKIAANKNKDGETMILNFVSVTKTKRHLYRDMTSPGKITKTSSSASAKSARSKMPIKIVPIPAKPITVTVGLNEVKDITKNLEKVKLEDSPTKQAKQELLKQQASVFDWVHQNAKEHQDIIDSPPSWFVDYMEKYKEELRAEITSSVVHSLGIVMDNKLTGYDMKKTMETKVQSKFTDKKAKKPRYDTEKVKKEVIRMSMEDESESKELKKLKKTLIKKTDKVVKVAMKIEKKQQQEEKRKVSLPSSSSELSLNLSAKKDKKETKKIKKIKAKKIKTKSESCDPIPVSTEAAACLIGLTDSPPVVQSESAHPLLAVSTNPLLETSHSSKGKVEEQLKILNAEEKFLSGKSGIEALINKELDNGGGKLSNAVYISYQKEQLQQVTVGEKVVCPVKITNMGSLDWTESCNIRSVISSRELLCPAASISLPALQPGQEETLDFSFTAPPTPGLYESVWAFFDGENRFGQPVFFKFNVRAASPVEMREFKEKTPIEMRNIGISAKYQEMVEMNSSTKENRECTIEIEAGDEEYDFLNMKESESLGDEDEFELIPVPPCFNLEVPFEIVEPTIPEKEISIKTTKDEVIVKTLQEARSKESIFTEKLIDAKFDISPNVQIEKLVELGFANRDENRKLLHENGNNLDTVLNMLCKDHVNNWTQKRH